MKFDYANTKFHKSDNLFGAQQVWD